MQAVCGDATDRGALRGEAIAIPSEPTFQAVYDEHFRFVWRCTRRLGVPAEALDDVVQEIFIVVHRRLNTLKRNESLRSWLYGVVRRTVSTYRRGRNVLTAIMTPHPSLDETPRALGPSPLDCAVMGDEVELLRKLLGQLDAQKREVLMLAELEEMTVPEIAQGIGIPLNTVYSRLRAARRAFNEALSRHHAQQITRR